MSQDSEKKTPEKLCVVVTGEDYIETATTDTATTPSLTGTSGSGSSSFEAPTNQTVVKSYQAIGLSPGSLKEIDEVQRRIDADNILDEDFDQIPMNKMVFRCIYFLYGKEYHWDDNRDGRVTAIKHLLLTADRRTRLRLVAIPVAGHKTMRKEQAKKLYLRVALTAECFFRQTGAHGGFPQHPVLRFQRSANCFAAAACVLCTLQWQKDMPNNPEASKPLDVAQLARRFALETDQEIKDRVIDNKGMSAYHFASRILGKAPSLQTWMVCKFDEKRGSELECLASILATMVEKGGKFGLVSNFHVGQSFKNAAIEETNDSTVAIEETNDSTVAIEETNDSTVWRPVLRYVEFDGFSIDTGGEVIRVDHDETLEDKYNELRDFYEKQLEEMDKTSKERQEEMAQQIPIRWQQGSAEMNTPNSSDDPTPGSSGKHAMVVIGTYRQKKRNELTQRDDQEHLYFMLLNSWHSMPLILVSPEYLAACGAHVYVLADALGTPPTGLERDNRVLGETSFVDGGDIYTDSAFFPDDDE